ncbi:Gp37 family protein [Pseudanabaena sp. PCC 6802]|uniref:Gp37 family protein n=1 Tax=Pseudanabaena sp. PCC 6802 TaxID=118173 RepID=UPI00034AD42F|nr:Gp37 family protein [Pseudanabaena sp. PCC 6802]
MASESRLAEIERAILERLAPLASAHNVRIGALDASELARPISKGAVFVNYQSSQSLRPDYNSEMESVIFEVLVKYEDLRQHSKAYPLLEAIRAKLARWAPLEYCNEMQWRGQKFVTQALNESGIWVYSLIFEVIVDAAY